MLKQILRRFSTLAVLLALVTGVFVASYSTPAQAQQCFWAGCDGNPCEGCAVCDGVFSCGPVDICCF
jgi:hypothetical protein